jgi:hypothetical protein
MKIQDVKNLMKERIEALNLVAAKADVLPFVKDQDSVERWTKELLLDAVERIR